MISRNINNNNYISQHSNLMTDKSTRFSCYTGYFRPTVSLKRLGTVRVFFFTEMNTFIFSKNTLDCSKESKVIKMFLNQQIII